MLFALAVIFNFLIGGITGIFQADVPTDIHLQDTYFDERRFRHNILFTIGLGSLFLLGVGMEWAEAFHFFPPSTGFGTVFFTLTGFHAFHVFTGLLALAVILYLGRKGRFTSGNSWGVEGVVKYWHFVDVAWVFLYPTLYLVS